MTCLEAGKRGVGASPPGPATLSPRPATLSPRPASWLGTRGLCGRHASLPRPSTQARLRKLERIPVASRLGILRLGFASGAHILKHCAPSPWDSGPGPSHGKSRVGEHCLGPRTGFSPGSGCWARGPLLCQKDPTSEQEGGLPFRLRPELLILLVVEKQGGWLPSCLSFPPLQTHHTSMTNATHCRFHPGSRAGEWHWRAGSRAQGVPGSLREQTQSSLP